MISQKKEKENVNGNCVIPQCLHYNYASRYMLMAKCQLDACERIYTAAMISSMNVGLFLLLKKILTYVDVEQWEGEYLMSILYHRGEKSSTSAMACYHRMDFFNCMKNYIYYCTLIIIILYSL